jgi:hypothetical protein
VQELSLISEITIKKHKTAKEHKKIEEKHQPTPPVRVLRDPYRILSGLFWFSLHPYTFIYFGKPVR